MSELKPDAGLADSGLPAPGLPDPAPPSRPDTPAHASVPPAEQTDHSSPTAPDPEDWQSSAASGDDERYLRERPPHWE